MSALTPKEIALKLIAALYAQGLSMMAFEQGYLCKHSGQIRKIIDYLSLI